MEDGFELLEQKVRRAAELVTELRQKNTELSQQASRAQAGLADAEKRLSALESKAKGSSAQATELRAAQGELERLHTERAEVRSRIARLVELLEGLE